MVEATNAECFQTTLGAGSTHNCPIGQCGLLVSTASASVCGLEARGGRTCWDASAGWEVNLRRSCAIEAALLAPSKEASTLAIFESIVSGDCIALRASRANADSTRQARVEFVVVDASQRESSLATFVGGITKIVVIHGLNGGLVIGRTRSRIGDRNRKKDCKIINFKKIHVFTKNIYFYIDYFVIFEMRRIETYL